MRAMFKEDTSNSSCKTKNISVESEKYNRTYIDH